MELKLCFMVYMSLAWIPFRLYDPFQVRKRVGVLFYNLKLPHKSKIHLVINVSLIRANLPSSQCALPDLPPVGAAVVTRYMGEQRCFVGRFKGVMEVNYF
jgi:hypothetical protein